MELGKPRMVLPYDMRLVEAAGKSKIKDMIEVAGDNMD
jgi:hypothetical protein